MGYVLWGKHYAHGKLSLKLESGTLAGLKEKMKARQKEGWECRIKKKAPSVLALKREINKLKSLIRDIQWVQPHYNGSPSCSCCGEQEHRGCDPDCEVAKITGDRGGAAVHGCQRQRDDLHLDLAQVSASEIGFQDDED